MALIKCPECGKEVSDKAEVCIHCGCPLASENSKDNAESDVATLNENENSQKKEEKINKKPKRNFIIIILIAIIIIVGTIIWINKPLSDDEMHDIIWDTYFTEGYDAGISKIIEFYGTGDEANAIYYVMYDLEYADLVYEIEITEKSLKNDGNYYDFVGTFKNNSDYTIGYFKYNIYLYNEEGEIIHSDWSNWSGTLKPDASVQADAMVDFIKGTSRYKIEIVEVTID